MLYKNLGNKNGVLTIGGVESNYLASKYGTPLYVLDENMIRENASSYVSALKEYAPEGSMPFFASKACSFKEIYRIIGSTGMGTDLVSPGEIYTAHSVGFDMKNSVFHGNCKKNEDIRYALDTGVGYFTSDTFEELDALQRIASEYNVKQKVLIRVTPGVDAHTHAAVTTGNVDSKFGFPMFSGDALAAVRKAASLPNIEFCGLHYHIGSQIFELEPFFKAADVAVDFIASCGVECKILNVGGGFGVAYAEDEETMDIRSNVKALCDHIRSRCAEKGVKMPVIFMEPGRSIAANAGTTLYTVGSTKHIPGIRDYVAIDGGMTDNPRYALYQSRYTLCNALKLNEKADHVCTVAGRCCESGDLIQENVPLAKPVRGDIIAVFGTGAYNFSMESTYNRNCRIPVVIIKDGEDRLAVKRETFEMLTSREI